LNSGEIWQVGVVLAWWYLKTRRLLRRFSRSAERAKEAGHAQSLVSLKGHRMRKENEQKQRGENEHYWHR
jgi:hypothetical protein